MTTIYATLNDLSLTEKISPRVTCYNQKTVQLTVDFSAEWDGFAKTAVFFTEKNKTVYEAVFALESCEIPSEVLTDAGNLYIGVRGVSDNKVKTSTLMKYRIESGAPKGTGTTVEPSSTVYQRILSAYEKVNAAVGVETMERKKEIATERARIDVLSKLGEGSTTGDAELIDGRISNGGHVHENIGEHIRSVSVQLNESIDNLKIDGYESSDYYRDIKGECQKIEGYFFRCPDSNMLAAGQWNCYTLPVKANERYRIKTYTVSAGAAVAFMTTPYDADEIDPSIGYYPATPSGGEIVDVIVTVPSNAVQMLVNEQTSQCTAIIEKYASKQFTRSSSPTSILDGKVLVCCGDSITEAVNPDGGYFFNYAESVAFRHGMTCHKDGAGGSTMAYGQGKSFSISRYLNVPEFDYLTIWFGWNDAAYSTLGTINDTDNRTFYGAYKLVLEHLITNNPTKKIGLIVPYGSDAVSPFAQAVRDISQRYGVPCLDLKDHNKCSLIWGTENPAQLARRNALTYDGTHPNQEGHDFLSSIYEQFLLSL